MAHSVLLTSFTVWQPHQASNSSDDLLAELLKRNLLDYRHQLLRQLPVDFVLAPQQVIAEIERSRPRLVVCCGMAEGRSHLTIETNGKHEAETIATTVDVADLVQLLETTTASHDAGQFVCNHLYYSVLKHLQAQSPEVNCIFAHVPLLNSQNFSLILQEFY
ncbi:MAG TPA: peptidase C15, partial [Thermosynechococcaceae cyanobacterium]